MPHELGRLPLTYYQTLVNGMNEEFIAATKGTSGSDTEGDSPVEVDVDAQIHKGRRTGFGAGT